MYSFYILDPFLTGQVCQRIRLLSRGSFPWPLLSIDRSDRNLFYFRVRSTERTRIQPTVLYGAVGWKQTSCPFLSDPNPWREEERIPIRLFLGASVWKKPHEFFFTCPQVLLYIIIVLSKCYFDKLCNSKLAIKIQYSIRNWIFILIKKKTRSKQSTRI